VPEWHQRISKAEEIQNDLRAGREEKAIALLRREGVTHLVWPAGQKVGEGVEMMYEDGYYRVYRMLPR
jgi:hypothetical protein